MTLHTVEIIQGQHYIRTIYGWYTRVISYGNRSVSVGTLSIFEVLKIYDFVAFDKYYLLVYKDVLEKSSMDILLADKSIIRTE
jgi:hypothetical protein